MKFPTAVSIKQKFRFPILALLVTVTMVITALLVSQQVWLVATEGSVSDSRPRKAEFTVNKQAEFKFDYSQSGVGKFNQQEHLTDSWKKHEFPSYLTTEELHSLRLKLDRDNLIRRFPSMVVIGFSKTAVDVVFEVLELHPSLLGHEGRPYQFFSLNYNASKIESYLKSLPDPRDGELVIEKGSDYITSPLTASRIIDSANNIRVDPSKVKFIVVLNDPTDCILSEYTEKRLKLVQLHPTGRVPTDSETPMRSCYVPHIEAWLQEFPQEQMCYVDSELLAREPHRELYRLEECLELSPFFMLQNIVPEPGIGGGYCLRTSRKTVCLNNNNTSAIDHSVHALRSLDTELGSVFRMCYEQLPALTGKDFTGWSLF